MLATFGNETAALATVKKIAKRALAPKVVAQVVADMLRTGEPAWRAWVEEGSREDISVEVGRLSAPALVLFGSDDAAIPPQVLESEVMPCLLAGRLVGIPGAGHLLPLEAADEVVRAIRTMAGTRN
jgi:pimeloyl-ACP methyl ester carboxylesterase